MLDAAIFGLGHWGQRLVRSVQGKSDRIRFVRGVARSPEKVSGFAREQGLDVHADYDAVLADSAVKAVVVATPHSLHHEHAMQAARAGKPVLVEKPFALTRADAEAAVAACETARVVMAVAHTRRFRHAYRDLKRLAEQDELGTLLHVEGNFSGGYRHTRDSWRASPEENPVGGVASRGIHALDLMIDLCGPIGSVQAFSERRVLEPGFMDDTSGALMRFANGSTGYLCTMMTTSPFWRLHVFGTKGSAAMEGEHTLVIRRADGSAPEIRRYPEDDMLRAELECFAGAVAGSETFPVRPEQAIQGVAAIEAMADSARRDGARVDLAPPAPVIAETATTQTHIQFGPGGS